MLTISKDGKMLVGICKAGEVRRRGLISASLFEEASEYGR